MGNDYKKQVLARAKQNRINHVTKSNKYYKKETSKSQKDFIAGDVVSSASKKAYYYKNNGLPEQSYITGGRSKANYKAIQEGKDPYKATYLYDGKKRTVKNEDGSTFTSRKRLLTDDEKKALKATGDTNVSNYKKNYKYAILRGVDSDGKNYDSHFNLLDKNGKMKWDGMNVAKNKVRKGGSKLNYVGGFLKDTIVDGGVDFLKLFDKYESGAMGGVLGITENVQDVADSITSGDFGLKNVDWGRVKKNWNESMKESNKTGWGLSAGHHLKGMSQRNDDQKYNAILKSKGQEKADKYRESEQKMQGFDNVVNTVLGLGLDIMNPVQLGTAFVKTLKYAGKNTLKAGKAMLNGTADISTGFKSDNVLDVLTNQGPLTKTNKHGSMLDQEYERVMNKADDVKEVIKSNPNTQNLGHFLDEIGKNVDSGIQRGFDGRTLNKTKTQVKDDYIPQTIRGEENVDNIVNNNKSNQLSFNSSNRLNNKYEKLYKSFNDEGHLFNAIDNLDNRSSDEFLDWLKTNNPSSYQKYMGNADELDTFANQGIQTQRLAEKSDNTLVNNFNKNAQTVSNKPKYNYDKIDNVSEENAVEKIASLFDEKTSKTFKNNYERKHAFESSIRDLSKNIQDGKIDIDDISQTIEKVKGEGVPVKLKREYVNNKLFGGDEVIANNVSGSSIDGLLDSIEDLTNLKKVVSEYTTTGEVLPVKLSEATKDFLKVDDNLKVVGSKVRGNKIHDPEELVETLNKSIIDRARALTDERYGDKLQLMAKEFGYEKFTDVTTALDKLITKRKKLDKIPGTSLDEKLELSANIKRLKEIISKRTDMWEKIKNLPESDFDKLINEKYPHHKGSLRSYQPKTEQSKLMEFLSKGDGVEDAKNMELDKAFEQGFGGNRSSFNDVLPEKKGNSLEVAINKVAKDKNLDNEALKKANEFKKNIKESERLNKYYQELGEFAKKIGVSVPKKTQVKVKLSKTQKLGSLPPVKENIDGLKTLIKKEVEEMYTNPTLYKENQRLYASLKKEYINGLRSYGVPDNAYFEKATNLKKSLIDDLKKQAEKNTDSLLDRYIPSGGKNKNIPKMNLQLLAKKVDDMFDEFGNKSMDELGEESQTLIDRNINSIESLQRRSDNLIKNVDTSNHTPYDYEEIAGGEDILRDFWSKIKGEELQSSSDALGATEKASNGPLDKLVDNTTDVAKNPLNETTDEVASTLDEYINGFDEFNQFDNAKKVTKETSKSTPKKSQKPSNEKIDEILERYKDYGNNKKFDDVDEFNAFRDSLDGKTQEQVDKLFNSSNPNNPPTFEKFKKFFTEKSTNTKVGYEDGGLYKVYKAWLNSWKKGLTVYNPGWHVQNFFQNKGQNYLALGPKALTSQKNARNVLNYINGVDKGAYELTSKSGKTYTKRELADLAKKYDVAEGMATNTTKSNGVFPWLEGKIDNSSGMKRILQSEQTARLHHFLTQIERGMSPEDASKSVNKYLFDYVNKTKADKMMSDFIDPFWSFHKSNAKMLTTVPFNQPSRVNNILRANRGLDDDEKDDEKVPNSFREHQLPFGSFKDEINGDNYNYFYDENMMPDVSKALPLENDDFDNKLNPLIRILMQQSKGEGNFGNKVVDKDKVEYDEITKNDRTKEIIREINPVMNPLVKAYESSKKHQTKTDEGKQTQSTTDKQKLMELIAYITGNKGKYYRDTR